MTTEAPQHARRQYLSVLVEAHRDELTGAWQELGPLPDFTILRGPETGLIMLKGRIGGGGAPFNLGEASMSRCVVTTAAGEVGFGHVLGRDPVRAELVARFDALLQTDSYRDLVRQRLLEPVAARVARERDLLQRETAATRVNFFTMVRGEDA